MYSGIFATKPILPNLIAHYEPIAIVNYSCVLVLQTSLPLSIEQRKETQSTVGSYSESLL